MAEDYSRMDHLTLKPLEDLGNTASRLNSELEDTIDSRSRRYGEEVDGVLQEDELTPMYLESKRENLSW